MPSASQISSNATPIATVTESKRLHISPLTEALLPRVLGIHLSVATNVSFHHLPNFPNKDYGFVTLPAAEAAMVKKKLHGTILRGEKVTIENARPDTRKDKVEQERIEDAETDPEPETQGRALRKRKREEGVIPGAVELPKDRKVKRGWTEPKSEADARKIKEKKDRKESKRDNQGKKDKKSKSKPSVYTDKEECLFQTTLPDNAKVDDGKKSFKKSKRHKNKNKNKDVVTIHEFENTTKHPSYLRQAANKDKKTVQEYDEEKGWVDEEGKVVEEPTRQTRKQQATRASKSDKTSKAITRPTHEEEEETSSSGTSSESEDDDDDSESKSETEEALGESVRRELRISTEPSVNITEPSPATPHPLETLFKKPKAPNSENSNKSNLEINTSFSFFAEGDGADDADRPKIEKSLETPGLPALKRKGLPNLSIPVTPYSQRDLHWRSQRSAAPTPDTAAPSKSSFGDPFGLLANIHKEREEDIEEEDEDEDIMPGIESDEASATPEIKSDDKSGPDGKDSEFSQWFWENRGANTRAWKKRKREAAKEQRNRESRKRKS